MAVSAVARPTTDSVVGYPMAVSAVALPTTDSVAGYPMAASEAAHLTTDSVAARPTAVSTVAQVVVSMEEAVSMVEAEALMAGAVATVVDATNNYF